MNNYYPETYEEARKWFTSNLDLLAQKWPQVRLESHPLSANPEVSIDWIWAEPPRKENLVIVSTGQHGIEGYAGAAMLKIFMEEFAPRLGAENTGLLLIHAINPWGMKYHRKVNNHSVDLNRNFIFDGNFDQSANPQFKHLDYLITPQSSVRSSFAESLLFWSRLAKGLVTAGPAVIASAPLLGQHHTPRGFYYGSTRPEEEATVLMGLFHKALTGYETVTHMDMHTGYGPRYQMSITLSPLELMDSAEASAKFNYPLAVKVNPEEFYAIQGDMVAYLYELRASIARQKRFFSCTFEFGTYGDSILKRLLSLRAMILENQLHWHGAVDESAARAVWHEFEELYMPTEPRWREKALADGRQAFEGILLAHNLIQEK